MSEQSEDAARGPSPEDALNAAIEGARITQLVYVAAKLGIADVLAEGPLTGDQIAHAVDAHPRALTRLMRALASEGFFEPLEDGTFALEPRSELLRSDAADSRRNSAIMAGAPWYYGAYGHLIHSVTTGETAYEHMYGKGFFEYLHEDPEEAAFFNDIMTKGTREVAESVADSYDFSGINTIVDVAGGHGALLGAVLQVNPGMRGILFEQAAVLEGAPAVLGALGVQERCELVAGSFFESVPSGADAYMMKWIIHDWDDERATAILKNCRRAMSDHGRLLIVEREMPAGNEKSPATLGDITMMVIPGGQERTREEYAAILDASGFRLAGIHATASEMSIFEALPA